MQTISMFYEAFDTILQFFEYQYSIPFITYSIKSSLKLLLHSESTFNFA